MPEGERRYPTLRKWETVGILAIAVTHFLIGVGPIWRHPWEPNASILWSYLPLPFLVLIVLLVRKRWTPLVWAFDTFRILVFKFLITALILVGIWSISKPLPNPKAPAPAMTGAQTMPSAAMIVPAGKSSLTPPTPLDEAKLGSIEGTAPPNALVYVSAGLDTMVFAPKTTHASLVHDGKSFAPAIVAVQVGQPLEVQSLDKKLHTLVAVEAGGRQVLSAPLVAMAQRSVMFMEPSVPMTVHCAVHADEPSAKILLFSHPFFAIASSEGAFRFDRVPAGTLRVRADALEKEVVVSPKATVRVVLR